MTDEDKQALLGLAGFIDHQSAAIHAMAAMQSGLIATIGVLIAALRENGTMAPELERRVYTSVLVGLGDMPEWQQRWAAQTLHAVTVAAGAPAGFDPTTVAGREPQ